jgi:exopolysaccharide biosynthesis polyprenyl glycosylphosphotransferase
MIRRHGTGRRIASIGLDAGSAIVVAVALLGLLLDSVLIPERPARTRSSFRIGDRAARGAPKSTTVQVPDSTEAAASVQDHGGQAVVYRRSGLFRALGLATKRLMDVVGASVGLVLLSPLLGAVAIAIVLTDGRPVLFRQQRAGLGGRTFVVLKFRTMTKDADSQRAALREYNEVEGHAAFKMTDDPRITRIGKILRKTSVDELPQLWNVLLGEMSLVGPRPHPLDDVAGYDPWHRRRLAMKPGITGLWQVAGRREPDFDRWVRYDLEYIDHWSLWLDLRLLIRTIPAMLRAEGR